MLKRLPLPGRPSVTYNADELEYIDRIGETYQLRCRRNGMLATISPRPALGAEDVVVQRTVCTGSNNERDGVDGSAHYLEHVGFKGSEKFRPEYKNGWWHALEPRGAVINAETNKDMTQYHTLVGSHLLRDTLAREADRMHSPLIRDEDVRRESKVVLSEYQIDSTQNMRTIYAEAYQAVRDHPARKDTIGNAESIRSTTAARLRTFYDTFYGPNRTMLSVVGYIPDETQLLDDIVEMFAPIPNPRGFVPQIHSDEPPQRGLKINTYHAPGGDYMINIAHKINGAHSKDTPSLMVLAQALSGSLAAPLNRMLVQTNAASSVETFVDAGRDIGMIMTIVRIPAHSVEQSKNRLAIAVPDSFCARGTDSKVVKQKRDDEGASGSCHAVLPYLHTVEQVVHQAYEQAGKADSDEWRQYIETNLAANKKALDLARRAGRNDLLSFANALGTAFVHGDWRAAFADHELLDGVTPESVSEVARRVTTELNRTVVYLIPEDVSDDVFNPHTGVDVDRSLPDTVIAALRERELAELREREDNLAMETSKMSLNARSHAGDGMTGNYVVRPLSTPGRMAIHPVEAHDDVNPQNDLFAVTMPYKGIVTVRAIHHGGGWFEDQRNEDAALLTARLVPLGAGNLDKFEIEKLERDMAIGVSVVPDLHNVYLTVSGNAEHVDDGLALMVKQMAAPKMLPEEFAHVKSQHIQSLLASEKHSGYVATSAIHRQLFPPLHAYYERPVEEQVAAVRALTLEDLRAFQKSKYNACDVDFIAAGYRENDQLCATVGKAMDTWRDMETSGAPSHSMSNRKMITVVVGDHMTPEDCAFRAKVTDANALGVTKHYAPHKQAVQVLEPHGTEENSIFMVARRTGITTDDADYYPLLLATHALGASFSNRLMQKVRNTDGLTYNIRSVLAGGAQGTEVFWTVRGAFDPQYLSDGIASTRGVIARLGRDGLEPAERNDANPMAWITGDDKQLLRPEVEFAHHLLYKFDPNDQLNDLSRWTSTDRTMTKFMYTPVSERNLSNIPYDQLRQEVISQLRRRSVDKQRAIQNIIFDSRSELGLVKQSIVQTARRMITKDSGVISRVADAIVRGHRADPAHWVDEHMYRIQTVSAEDVDRVAKKYFALENTDMDTAQVAVVSLPEDEDERRAFVSSVQVSGTLVDPYVVDETVAKGHPHTRTIKHARDAEEAEHVTMQVGGHISARVKHAYNDAHITHGLC